MLGSSAVPHLIHSPRSTFHTQAMRPGDSMTVMLGCTVALLVAAFLRPFPRTILFVTLGAVLFFSYFYIVNLNLCLQVAMYLSGAAFFLRYSGRIFCKVFFNKGFCCSVIWGLGLTQGGAAPGRLLNFAVVTVKATPLSRGPSSSGTGRGRVFCNIGCVAALATEFWGDNRGAAPGNLLSWQCFNEEPHPFHGGLLPVRFKGTARQVIQRLLSLDAPRQGCCPLHKSTRFNERDGKATPLWGVGFASAAHSAAAVLLMPT